MVAQYDSRGRWYPGLVLKVYWDEATEPSVCAPLADFFGAIAQVLGCRALLAVKTKEAAGEAGDEIVGIRGIRFSEDSRVDLFSIGR